MRNAELDEFVCYDSEDKGKGTSDLGGIETLS